MQFNPSCEIQQHKGVKKNICTSTNQENKNVSHQVLLSRTFASIRSGINTSKNSYLQAIQTGSIYRWIILIAIMFILGALQTVSMLHFSGDRVDESELYHFAVGFWGNDWDVHWYEAYGPLGMYLLSFFYLLLYPFFYLSGAVQSLDQYASQLFTNGFFLHSARWLYATIGIGTAFIYAQIARKFQVPWILIILYIIIVVFSLDGLTFANYLRTDRLVSLFTALAILFSLNNKPFVSLALMIVSIAAAIACKISAVPLLGFFGIYLIHHLYKQTITWKQTLILVALFIICTFLFQPFTNWGAVAQELLDKGTGGSKGYPWWWPRNQMLETAIELNGFYIKFIGLPLMLAWLGLLFSSRHLRPVLIPLLLALTLLVIPYGKSNFLRDYWFIPAFDIGRFLSILGIASIYFFLKKHFHTNKLRWLAPTFLALITITVLLWVIKPGVNRLQTVAKASWSSSNKQIATTWIEQNIAGKKPIYYDEIRHYVMPHVYDVNNFSISQDISRAFIYNRLPNTYLQGLFLKYLYFEHFPKLGVPTVFQQIEEISITIDGKQQHECHIKNIQLCKSSSKENKHSCIPVKTLLKSGRSSFLKHIETDVFYFSNSKQKSTLIIKPPFKLIANGDYELHFESQQCSAKRGKIHIHVDHPSIKQMQLPYFTNQKINIPLIVGVNSHYKPIDFIHPLDTIRDLNKLEKLPGTYFITSSNVYQKFLEHKLEGLNPDALKEATLFKKYYQHMTSFPLLKRFDSGDGPDVEIYSIH